MKKLRYMAEAGLLYAFFIIVRIMPLDMASALGGWIGRTVGPRLAASRKALANLERALPELDEQARRAALSGMWDNLGRIMAEYPHLEQIGRERTAIIGADIVHALKEDGQPGLIFSGHIGNWEALHASLDIQQDFRLDLIYRAPNNPYADQLLLKCRSRNGIMRAIPKSFSGTRDIVQSLKDGRHIAILIDQKYNEGVPVPFFGHAAMTSTAFVQLAQKFKCPLVPVWVERTKGANFILRIFPPMGYEGKSTDEVVADAHDMLEEWVRARPEQWLWLHRRWPKDSA